MNQESTSPSKKTKVRRTEEEWRTLIEGFVDSGLPLNKYCQSHGIASSGFYKWRKRLELDESDTPSFVEMLPPKAQPLPSQEELDQAWRLELHLGDGMILRVR